MKSYHNIIDTKTGRSYSNIPTNTGMLPGVRFLVLFKHCTIACLNRFHSLKVWLNTQLEATFPFLHTIISNFY